MLDSISFTINGKPFNITSKTVPIDTTLNTFIRNHANLNGTKFMCLEGGCGACIVNVRAVHPVHEEIKSWAVNSCLTLVFSCHGYEITTIEGVGNRLIGYHEIQRRLAKFNGSQCGYCSPGMVMNMYSLLEANEGSVSMKEVENSFGGNICRCTGYRPILDAFKSMAIDADQSLLDKCADIEDLAVAICPKTGESCESKCGNHSLLNGSSNGFSKPLIRLDFNDTSITKQEWHKITNLEELFAVLDGIESKSYHLSAGNTAHGVYRRRRDIDVFIDITDVTELRTHSISDEAIIIGGGVSLTETIQILQKATATPGFEYCEHLVKHIDLIANVPVRNAGTIAGNLCIKHQHLEFPSDIFILLESVGAQLTIAGGVTDDDHIIISPSDFLYTDLKNKIILNVKLPALDPDIFVFRSYKIMPRAQNAHAYINAGFLIELDQEEVKSARICFGGVELSFVHATQTEQSLIGKQFYSNETLTETLNQLSDELKPDHILPDASPEYRKMLSTALFYKFVLATCDESKLNLNYKCGGDCLDRDLSSGVQETSTKEEKWPLTKNIPKFDGMAQTTGEAKFINDMPPLPDQLWAAFVPATEVHTNILHIDATDALNIRGVHHFFSAKDIPGKNNFTPTCMMAVFEEEEIFIGENSRVLFNGQPCGIILADTFDLANYAATKVKVIYGEKDDKPIITTLRDAHKYNCTDQFIPMPFGREAVEYGTNPVKKITGSFEVGSQYHLTMEPHTTICIPSEHGLDVYTATQWLDFSQVAIAEALNIPNHHLHMVLRRIGGGYGVKFSRSAQIACACALAAFLTQKPIRFVISLESNMTVVGKRYPCRSDYKVEIDETGKIQRLKNRFEHDLGTSMNDNPQFHTTQFFQNCYIPDTFDVEAFAVKTNTPCNTWCRAPGTTEGIAMIENIMEHIARETGQNPVNVRLANIADDNKMKELLPDFLEQCQYYERFREIESFNQENRWRKRGIAVVPMEYHQGYFGSLVVHISVFHADGTIAISHAGSECGQGIHTKVAQTAAHVLGVPLEDVRIKEIDNMHAANAMGTAGSITSEAVCFATKRACEELLERLKPLQDELDESISWKELIKSAHAKGFDLTTKNVYTHSDLTPYTIWGISCAEVEVDILTGSILLKRVDILEDTGESLSPGIDVGQVEGAFIMGVGYWLTEAIIYDPNNGELLTNRTWTYKPPGAKDIPIDFRVKFLKNSSNESFVLRSKATGEPSLCMSVVTIFALRHAIESARNDAGITEKWFSLGAPTTPETIFLNSGSSIDQFKLN